MPSDESRLIGRRTVALPASATAALDARLKDLAADGQNVINLTSGEVSFPTPMQASAGATKAIEDGFTRYTAVAGIRELREAVAEWLAARNGTTYAADQILVSGGAKQALFHAFMVLLDPGDEVLLSAPYWVSFPHMITLAGGAPVVVPTEPSSGFKITPDMLSAHVTARTRVLLLNNPGNPTGTVYSRAELEAIAELALRLRLTIVSDEIYAELVYPPAAFTSVACIDDETKAATVTVNGVSKTFAMTGWRIGFAAGPQPVIKAMTAVQGHTASGPCSISQRAALAALTSTDLAAELARRRTELDQRRKALIRGLATVPRMHVPVEPAGAFYLLADVTASYGCRHGDFVIDSASAFAAALLESELVGVVPGESFGAPGYVRISYVDEQRHLTEGVARIHNFTSALSGSDAP